MTLPLWLWEGIEEREGMTLEADGDTTLGDGPSIRDKVDDREAKNTVEAHDFKFSHNHSLLSHCDWGGMLEAIDSYD
jgi:hypothetical protein